MRKLPLILVPLGIVILLIWSSVFIVDERKQALVLQFGQVKRVIKGEGEGGGPGLYFKIPLVQNVVFYEDRILGLETSEQEVTPLDDRRLVVDAFARWRIVDPVLLRQAAEDEGAARRRLERIVNASLREVLGSVVSDAVLSPERTALMQRIANTARSQAAALGVEIVDVRIRRADLPPENLEATYRRMNAEREREARDERARGKERAQEVMASADREAVILVSDAEREAQLIRGEADSERNRIYAEAFGRDAEFFAFYRSMMACERALRAQNTTMVIALDSVLCDYLDVSVTPGGTGVAVSGDEAGGTEGGAPASLPEEAPEAAPDTAPEAEPAPEEAPDGAALEDSAPDTAAASIVPAE